MNRGTLSLMIAFAFIFILVLHTREIFASLGQHAEVSKNTYNYLLFYFPGLVVYGMSDLYRKYLNSYRLVIVPLLSFGISVSLHSIWCNMIVLDYGYKIEGIAIAGFITNSLNFSIIYLFTKFIPVCK